MRLNTTYGKAFVVCSIGMIVFSIWAGVAAKSASSQALAAADAAREAFPEGDASQAMYDAGMKALEDSRTGGVDRIHFYVKAVSVPYFLFSAFVFGVLARHGGWLLWLSVGASLMMLAWTFLLSRSIDFSEVYLAWVVASALLGLLMAFGLRVNSVEQATELQISPNA
jgi:hypothetical protein